jgi:uncharacterized damage-inducible protein DinB
MLARYNRIANERLFAACAQLDDAEYRKERGGSRIEEFFAGLDAAFWGQSFAYTNNQGKEYVETAPAACSHLFNHQTHRAQVHVRLSQTAVAPPSVDLHRIINP